MTGRPILNFQILRILVLFCFARVGDMRTTGLGCWDRSKDKVYAGPEIGSIKTMCLENSMCQLALFALGPVRMGQSPNL